MGERKGLAKYYPPDFDPSKLSRIKRPKDGQISSHFMLPMSIRCLTCGEFMGAGLKFNAKKSTAAETYLGAKIYRFSMKCKACPASFVIKTDPKNSDYDCESGAKRNFQAWRADRDKAEEVAAAREDQDEDAMQALENKTLDARQEMEDLDALEELRASKARNARVSAELLLSRHRQMHDGEEALEEEARAAFRAKNAQVRRLADDDEDVRDEGSSSRISLNEGFAQPVMVDARISNGIAKRKAGTSNGVPFVFTKKKAKKMSAPAAAQTPPELTESAEKDAPVGLVAYGGESDSGSSSSEEST